MFQFNTVCPVNPKKSTSQGDFNGISGRRKQQNPCHCTVSIHHTTSEGTKAAYIRKHTQQAAHMLTHFQGGRACMGARAVTALSITALLVFCACICTHNYELSDTIALTQSRHLLHNQIRTVEGHLVLIFGSTVFKTTKLLLTILLVVHLYTCVYWIAKVRLHFEHPLTAQSALLKLLSLLMLCACMPWRRTT